MAVRREGEDAVRNAIRAACQKEGTQKAWAEKHGISPVVLSRMLSGSMVVSDRMAFLVGFERVTVYRQTMRAFLERPECHCFTNEQRLLCLQKHECRPVAVAMNANAPVQRPAESRSDATGS
jgi:DNA-binding transcriptional regulator YdaS (Cro superfamily)